MRRLAFSRVLVPAVMLAATLLFPGGCAPEEAPAPITSPGIITNPACVNAWNTIDQAGATDDLRTLIAHDCQILHTEGWLSGAGTSAPDICVPAWNALVDADLIDDARTLVTDDCPIVCEKFGSCG